MPLIAGFGVLIHTKSRRTGYFNIVSVDDVYVGLADKDGSSILLASKNSYQDNTFADGTPFGIRENF